MKRWLKKHGRCLVVGLAVLFIGYGSWGVFIATEGWEIVLNVCTISIWVVVVLLASGALKKLFDWWDKN